MPLCKDKNNDIGGGSAGSVGWLDLSTALGATTTGSCPNQFKNAIQNPCIVSLPFPTWIQTFPGGVGKGGGGIQDALNAFHNDVVQIPLFDGTCKVQPPGPALGDCAPGDIGVGANTWYHIPSFASFKLDYFYINGNDRKQCDKLPGAAVRERQRRQRLLQGLVGRRTPRARGDRTSERSRRARPTSWASSSSSRRKHRGPWGPQESRDFGRGSLQFPADAAGVGRG